MTPTGCHALYPAYPAVSIELATQGSPDQILRPQVAFSVDAPRSNPHYLNADWTEFQEKILSDPCESEKRQFVRVPANIKVGYRFISQGGAAPVPDTAFTGHTVNLGAGGLLLVGHVPDNDLIADLLMRRVSVVLDIHLPKAGHSIRALARVAWLEAIDPTNNTCPMGLTFKEITASDQDELFRFIINAVAG